MDIEYKFGLLAVLFAIVLIVSGQFSTIVYNSLVDIIMFTSAIVSAFFLGLFHAVRSSRLNKLR